MIVTKTYPLQSISMEEAKKLQFWIVDCITNEFQGHEILSRGDLGVVLGLNQPLTTQKAERVIGKIFGAEESLLVRGAGSAAIRFGLHAMLKPGEAVLVHKAPVYETTETSFRMMGLHKIEADFNNLTQLCRTMGEHPEIRGVVIQHTRQLPEDCYELSAVIKTIKKLRDIPVLVDDNYAALKTPRIGSQCGADLSCFSSFKLLGPEGIGIIVGKKKYLDLLKKEHYSGGMQTQGHEAMDVLHGLVYAPVALAIEAQESELCVQRLKAGEIPDVKDAFLANAQSKVILVELKEEIAEKVLRESEKLGAAPYPIGCESKYEMVPLFYRISGTFRKGDPFLEHRMIRINPLRAGSDTVIRILKESIERVKVCL